MGDNIKLDNDKLNKSLEVKKDLPEVPRTEAGVIDLEAITIEIDEKGNRIIADDIFDSYYKELPEKVINQSRTKRSTASGGYIGIFGGDPEADLEKQRKGREAQAAAYRQRRKISETIDELLKKKATPEELEEYNLPEGATKQDAMIASMLQKAIEKGDVAAGAFIRDTAGEKPTENISASVQMIPDQEKLLEEFNRIITE